MCAVRPDLPDDFLAILNRMLAKSPDARFQTPADLVGELTVFANRHGLQPAASGSVVCLAPCADCPDVLGTAPAVVGALGDSTGGSCGNEPNLVQGWRSFTTAAAANRRPARSAAHRQWELKET